MPAPVSYCPLRKDSCRIVDCAWYDEFSKSCAVLLLARRFDAVTSIENKLLVDTPEPYYVNEDVSCSRT